MSRLLAILLILSLAGCALPQRAKVSPSAATAPATQPSDPSADLTLDQLVPDARDALRTPATAPASPPSLDALDAYARGRGALADRQVYTAVNLLEKAAALDPHSAQVHYELGRAYSAAGKLPQAVESLQRAVALNPEFLDALVDLSRLTARSAPEQALRSLAIATHTREYASNDADAAIVDFYLARLLQQRGHDRAAIEQYEKLLWRLSRRSLAIRGSPDVAALANRPEPLQLELAKLYEKRGDRRRAIGLYQRIAEKAPDAPEPQARLIRAQIAAGEIESARKRARELVSRWNANALSVELLRDACRAAGDESQAIAELQRMHAENPGNRSVLMALADVLAAEGRHAEAEKLISDAAGASGGFDLLRKLVRLYSARNDTSAAARLLIENSVRRPEACTELWELWQPLIRSWRVNALGPEELLRLQVPESHRPAQLFWAAVVAQGTARPSPQRVPPRLFTARRLMQQAVEAEPLFEPAYRARVRQIWNPPQYETTSVEAQQAQTAELAARARRGGREALALQIEAIAAGHFMESPRELPLFEAALAAGEPPPDFLIDYANALARASARREMEQWLWKLISDHPFCGDGYAALLQHYYAINAPGPAAQVVNHWLSTDPLTPGGRIAQAAQFMRVRHLEAVEALMLDLVKDDPANESVLRELKQFYLVSDRAAAAADLLEDLLEKDPSNGAAIEILNELHLQQGETPAALRALDRAAQAAPEQANLLYHIAGLYYRSGEKERSQQMMERALRADPQHVSSSNDLAYHWAEAGRNLVESERLARQAVAAEPDNSAYLDTLGWVLYKQGRFEEAREYLSRAVATAAPLDPIVLDHLGDVLYRLGDVEQAAENWRSAADLLARMNVDREEYSRLRLELQNKLRQRSENLPVDVSPVAEARN
ncbi:MAG: tetratricopeptide repeat protein [Phycisphaerae bacterium]|nr:tetratricopeptide repeat protein [Phycisphaerae bacterium]MDW8261871.1 tetratricopeptide repeat protein [Phycisphaerales bacterium]